ncbi:hypothetical protein [Cerasicoccus maritimus]|uniref:hypothetical protein n=1 Tax=Cerasicoccus maritimus TaxID=490089 RepID=UPI002852757D|nr:hypothetical protein [Cerasicoccus maritimus]
MNNTLRTVAALMMLAHGSATAQWSNADTLNLLKQEALLQRAVRPPPAGPMLIWTGVGFDPLPPSDIKAIRSLGFNQHLPLTKHYGETAQALYDANAPIQIMEGLKQFPIQAPNGSTRPFPQSPEESLNLRQWRQVSRLIDESLGLYEDKAISVDALWLDYEGFPFSAPYPKATSSTVSPANVSPEQWPAFHRQLALNVASTYICAPARERFPAISTLNWLSILSFPENPVKNVIGEPTATSGPTLFTHSNPYAYGNTLAFEKSGLGTNSNQQAVDQFYLNLLLRHVSIDAQNRISAAPYLGAIPWVARIVRDGSTPELPTMSRSTYREALRHLWLRDIDGMLVFNSPHLSREEHQAEILDVAQVWREFEPHYSLIRKGKTCNLAMSNAQCHYLWSGKATSSAALVHFTVIGPDAPPSAQVTLWNKTYNFPLPQNGGKTFYIWRGFGSVELDIITELSTTP